jgi:hypothetical protein
VYYSERNNEFPGKGNISDSFIEPDAVEVKRGRVSHPYARDNFPVFSVTATATQLKCRPRAGKVDSGISLSLLDHVMN